MLETVASPDRFLQANGAQWGLRALQANGFDAYKLREHQLATNASLLTYDQWKDIDTAVAQPARLRLSAAADLLALPQRRIGIWQAIVQFQTGGYMDPAEVTMDPRTLVDRDRVAFETHLVPVPFISKEFSLTLRETSVPGGTIETANAMAASRAVNEKIEDMVVNGASNIVVNGAPLYGYRTHPNRIIGGALSQAWDTADNIFKGVAEVLNSLWDKQYRDNIVLYLNNAEMMVLMSLKEGVDTMFTTLDRVQRSFSTFGLSAIRVSDSVPAGNLVAVAMTADNVDMVVAQTIRTLQWDERGGMVTNFLVMAAMAPRIKPITGTGGSAQVGIAHFTTT